MSTRSSRRGGNDNDAGPPIPSFGLSSSSGKKKKKKASASAKNAKKGGVSSLTASSSSAAGAALASASSALAAPGASRRGTSGGDGHHGSRCGSRSRSKSGGKKLHDDDDAKSNTTPAATPETKLPPTPKTTMPTDDGTGRGAATSTAGAPSSSSSSSAPPSLPSLLKIAASLEVYVGRYRLRHPSVTASSKSLKQAPVHIRMGELYKTVRTVLELSRSSSVGQTIDANEEGRTEEALPLDLTSEERLVWALLVVGGPELYRLVEVDVGEVGGEVERPSSGSGITTTSTTVKEIRFEIVPMSNSGESRIEFLKRLYRQRRGLLVSSSRSSSSSLNISMEDYDAAQDASRRGEEVKDMLLSYRARRRRDRQRVGAAPAPTPVAAAAASPVLGGDGNGNDNGDGTTKSEAAAAAAAASSSSGVPSSGGNIDAKSAAPVARRILEPYIKPGMSLEERVRARADHRRRMEGNATTSRKGGSSGGKKTGERRGGGKGGAREATTSAQLIPKPSAFSDTAKAAATAQAKAVSTDDRRDQFQNNRNNPNQQTETALPTATASSALLLRLADSLRSEVRHRQSRTSAFAAPSSSFGIRSCSRTTTTAATASTNDKQSQPRRSVTVVPFKEIIHSLSGCVHRTHTTGSDVAALGGGLDRRATKSELVGLLRELSAAVPDWVKVCDGRNRLKQKGTTKNKEEKEGGALAVTLIVQNDVDYGMVRRRLGGRNGGALLRAAPMLSGKSSALTPLRRKMDAVGVGGGARQRERNVRRKGAAAPNERKVAAVVDEEDGSRPSTPRASNKGRGWESTSSGTAANNMRTGATAAAAGADVLPPPPAGASEAERTSLLVGGGGGASSSSSSSLPRVSVSPAKHQSVESNVGAAASDPPSKRARTRPAAGRHRSP